MKFIKFMYNLMNSNLFLLVDIMMILNIYAYCMNYGFSINSNIHTYGVSAVFCIYSFIYYLIRDNIKCSFELDIMEVRLNEIQQ